MKIVAHISDLHFGIEDEAVAAALVQDLARLAPAPALVIISGDFTQRARQVEFVKAQAFLRSIPGPWLAVPGNHDIPFYDVLRRFIRPLRRYRRFISPDPDPWFQLDDLHVLGINTARSLTWKSGRISFQQILEIQRRFASIPNDQFKLLVTHHPFIPPPGDFDAGIDLVGRASEALKIIDRCGVDLLLAGHLHHGYTGDIRTFYPATARSIVVAQAGTAISRRLRNEPNAYNVVCLDNDHIKVSVRVWRGAQFEDGLITSYRLVGLEWQREDFVQPLPAEDGTR